MDRNRLMRIGNSDCSISIPICGVKARVRTTVDREWEIDDAKRWTLQIVMPTSQQPDIPEQIRVRGSKGPRGQTESRIYSQ